MSNAMGPKATPSPALVVRNYRIKNPNASFNEMLVDLGHHAFNKATLRTQYSRQKPDGVEARVKVLRQTHKVKIAKIKSELKNGQIGQAGEYFVIAELVRRGWLAAIINGNSPVVDILASKGDHTIQVQVKATMNGHRGAYPLKPSSFHKYVKYIFVSMNSKIPRYFIVPGVIVDKIRYQIGNNGRVNANRVTKYEDCWDLLESGMDVTHITNCGRES
jgi:hypothetical protein